LTYVVIITESRHLREFEKANYHKDTSVSRTVHQQPPYKIIEKVGTNLEFK